MQNPRKIRRRALLFATALLAGGPLGVASVADGATPAGRNGTQPVGTAARAAALGFGQWEVFDIPTGTSLSSTFRFSSKVPVALQVTDARCRGDEFRVYDRGFALFNTSQVGTDRDCNDIPFVPGPFGAWQDQSYSKGEFLLQPGSHWVRIRLTERARFGEETSGFLRIQKRPIG